ncbi:MAG: PAS domain S-box protein [Bryobacteraceae bacterium]
MAPFVAPSIRDENCVAIQAPVFPVVVAHIDSAGRRRIDGSTAAIPSDEFLKAVLPFVERARSGETVHLEKLLPTSGPRPARVQLTIMPDFGARGALRGVVAVAIDISRHSRGGRQDGRAGEAAVPAILECSAQAIAGVDAEGRIRFCNSSTERLFGYPREELLGAPAETLLPEDLRKEHRLRRTEPGNGRQCRPMAPGAELYARRKDGSEFPVEIHLSSVDTGAGRITIAFVSDLSERKLAEAAQRDAARRLYLALRATNSAAWDWRSDGGGGESLLRAIVRCSVEDGDLDAIHPEDRARLRESADAIIASTARFLNADYRVDAGAGEYRWHTVVGRVIGTGATGEPRVAAGIVTDIDDRRRAEQERDLFFTLAPDPLCITSKEGRFLQVNPAFTQLLGWSEEELTSTPFLDTFVHPGDRESSRAAFAELLATGRLGSVENRFLCRDGGFRWLQWRPSTATDANRIYGVARDVTAQRVAERERQLLGELVHATDAFVALTETSGRIHFLNRAAYRLTGLTAIPNSPIEEIIPGLEGVTGHWHGEASMLRSGVEKGAIPVEVYRFPIPSGDDEPEIIGVIARDISQRKKNEARLHSLAAQLLTVQEDERSRIARELHDDFTQKLAVVGMELGTIRKQTANANPQIQASLRKVQDRIARLSEDARLLSHQLHPASLEFSGLAGALHSHCREVSRQRGIRVHCTLRSVPDAIPKEVEVAFYRIAQEALRNVVRHANANSATVTLAGEHGRLRLTITDDGCGFDSGRARAGAGIGLDSIEERARLIGASVQIDSLAGEGTSVAVEAPYGDAAQPSGQGGSA